jgi:hypothetical protein
VYLKTNGMRMRQDVLASGSYVSSNNRRPHFGLLIRSLIRNKIAIQVKFERFMRERGEDCGNKFSAARTQAS